MAIISYRRPEEDRFFKIRNILNIIFILTVVPGMTLFFMDFPHLYSYILIGIGMVVKFVECILRMIN